MAGLSTRKTCNDPPEALISGSKQSSIKTNPSNPASSRCLVERNFSIILSATTIMIDPKHLNIKKQYLYV